MAQNTNGAEDCHVFITTTFVASSLCDEFTGYLVVVVLVVVVVVVAAAVGVLLAIVLIRLVSKYWSKAIWK